MESTRSEPWATGLQWAELRVAAALEVLRAAAPAQAEPAMVPAASTHGNLPNVETVWKTLKAEPEHVSEPRQAAAADVPPVPAPPAVGCR
jgi:hypothetical protein